MTTTQTPVGKQPNHYNILSITPSLLATTPNPSSLLKQAYHRALLQNHPDKRRPAPSNPSSTSPSAPSQAHIYTIDQISTAYRTLSDPACRSAYDASLLTSRQADGSDLTAGADGGAQGEDSSFRTGVESVDLDDLECHEDGAAGAAWWRSCRCGNPRGFAFGEQDLEDATEVGELVVGCSDCSLWLRVHFAVLEE